MRRALAALLWALLWGAAAQAGSPSALFNEQGYRSARYRAPLPDSVPHGRRIDAAGLRALIGAEQPLLIDVQPVTVRPELAEFGVSFLPNKQRLHIPGSHWLPNVGYGELDARMARYLRDNLARLSGGDRARPLVFYCIADCWMSWNAVQRAHDHGHTRIYWLAGGSDEWAAAGGELVEGQPLPLAEDPD